jgi:hypothetical protein
MLILNVSKEFRRMVQCICLDCCCDRWPKGSVYLHGLYLVWMIFNWTSPAASFSRFLFNCCLNGDCSRGVGYILLKATFANCSTISHLYFFRVRHPVYDRKRFTQRNAYLEWNIGHFICKAALSAGVASSRFLSGHRFEWYFPFAMHLGRIEMTF